MLSIQLQFQFDRQKPRIMWCALGHIGQKELIQGLGEMFVSFIQVKKEEVIGDENDDQPQNQ